MIRIKVKKIFKVCFPLSRKTDNSLEVPNVRLCQTESLKSKQGGPQTKNCDYLKAWVEEKASFEEKRQCFFEIIQV